LISLTFLIDLSVFMPFCSIKMHKLLNLFDIFNKCLNGLNKYVNGFYVLSAMFVDPGT
jgi:hypothetical protein